MGRPKINTGNCRNGCDKPADALGICKPCYKKQYYAANRHKESKNRRSHNRANNKKIASRKRLRETIDVNYKLANRLRHRLNTAIKGGGAIEYLGCSIEELKIHLESKFQPKMSWANHGKYGWHIDHIVPLCKFNLVDIEELKKACHHTNLRPLWWKENLTRRYGEK
jgi:hypothetical protein